MRVLVCGGEDYGDEARARAVLDGLHADSPISCIIQGGGSGADRLGRHWAALRGVAVQTYVPRRHLDGRAAGARRNQAMVDHGRPDVAIAFPGGRDTADVVRRACAAGIRVIAIGAPRGASAGAAAGHEARR
jgi:hypothetical protein